jgi:LmbE family N-acetylglucosaminyl deacetylase
VAEACFYSGLVKIGTEDQGKSQEPWRPSNLYHYVQDTYVSPDFVIDITAFMERKMEAVMAYKTQFYSPGSKEPTTPISTPEFLEFLRARATEMGRNIQVRYAEGFTTVHPPGVKSFFDLH